MASLGGDPLLWSVPELQSWLLHSSGLEVSSFSLCTCLCGFAVVFVSVSVSG